MPSKPKKSPAPLAIEHVAPSTLTPAPYNPRKMDAAERKRLERGITEFGLVDPIIARRSDGMVIGGHQRLASATNLGLATVPVVYLDDISDDRAAALNVLLNNPSAQGQWEMSKLSDLLSDLDGNGFDATLTGFDDDELAKILSWTPDPENGLLDGVDPDAVPDAPAEPTTKPGDLITLGRHRLVCGDATDPESVARLVGGVDADICFTSPPYGQQRDYGAAIEDWDHLMSGVFGILPVKHEAQVLVNLGLIHRDGEWVPYWDRWMSVMQSLGWRRFGWYVWDQGPGLPGDWNGRLAPSHEFVFHFNRIAERARKTKPCKHAGHANHGSGLRAKDGSVTGYSHKGKAVQDTKVPDSVIRVMRHKARGIEVSHPAVFPVEFAVEMLAAFSDNGDVAYEPFAGSGSTIIAAETCGRSVLAMELEPKYCDVIVTRWENATGQKAVRPA